MSTTHYLVLDFESYYSKEYSLRKMTPIEYILDPRFECIGCAVIEGLQGGATWRDPQTLKELLIQYRALQRQGHKVVVISHNALFDMCLLRWRFGFNPDLMIDTMGMSRALIAAFTRGVSLKIVAKYLGLPDKGDTVHKVIGMTAAMIKAAGFYDEYAAYSCNDAELCRDIFMRLRGDLPQEEYAVMDMVIRMATSPRFKLNPLLLHEYHAEVVAKKDLLLLACGLETREALMSNDKFADVLRERFGIEPETKISPVTGKANYAFSKTDQFMADLEEHDNPEVQALVAARLGFKSTLEETRSKRMADISMITWPGNVGTGWFPNPLRYSGAHTHRLSGDWSLNTQNWSRGGKIRQAVEAAPGHVVVTCDASQIEARLVAWFCGQQDLVDAFAQGRDIYSEFAGQEVYHKPVNKKDHPQERFVGKQVILGCGFGVGGKKFRHMINTLSRLQLGIDMGVSEEWASTVVQAYRRRYDRIPAGWKYLTSLFPVMAAYDSKTQWGPVTFRHQYIEGPNGLKLFYHQLRQEVVKGDTAWVCDFAGRRKFLHGGLVMENIIQHLARVFIFQVALKMKKVFPKYPLAHQVHDELIYVVPKEIEFEFKAALLATMSVAPGWAPGLPVAAEAGSGPTYGDAK